MEIWQLERTSWPVRARYSNICLELHQLLAQSPKWHRESEPCALCQWLRCQTQISTSSVNWIYVQGPIGLLKILGRFGDKLAQHPLIIYNLIPRFSPPKSRIHRQCCANEPTRGPVLNGLSSENWDNVFTKIAVSRGCKVQKIACGDKYFALSTSSARGIIKIFRTHTCEELVEISFRHQLGSYTVGVLHHPQPMPGQGKVSLYLLMRRRGFVPQH